uniref:Cytochrome c oxidase subunit 3 n=1 Tax=Terebratalia transversa TaxID=34513 RepID=Q953X6_TERTR|nr:cytochrome c oxidase subunit III [Terebratalia transversa]AAK95500.1 cytochrome oxidase subunit 3 [Terebratalia transversa]
MQQTRFHLVQTSPWPFTGAISALSIAVGLAYWMHGGGDMVLGGGVLLAISTMVFWWWDVTREGTFQGWHTSGVVSGLQAGMILFIISEVCFFFSFFWAFFHSCLSTGLTGTWPPSGVEAMLPFATPLLNTFVLLSSGFTVTWSHYYFLVGNSRKACNWLVMTVLLGGYFTLLQYLEYCDAPFSISDSVYGSIFFVATGFHGLHVLIGSVFLLVSDFRHYSMHSGSYHHFGLEAAIWYWHFVDVVWLFLFVFIYCWGF